MPLFSQQALLQWCETPIGRYMLDSETIVLNQLLTTIYNADILVLGGEQFLGCIAGHSFNNIYLAIDDTHNDTRQLNFDFGVVCTRSDKLAIDSHSMDIVYLAHCLEFVNNPHEVLREAYRILKPSGYLVITGFNPYSCWGLRGIFSRKSPYYGSFIGINKIYDWISLLGAQTLAHRRYMYRLPIGFRRVGSIRDKLLNAKILITLDKIFSKCYLFGNNCYAVIAQKQVIPLTLSRELSTISDVDSSLEGVRFSEDN